MDPQKFGSKLKRRMEKRIYKSTRTFSPLKKLFKNKYQQHLSEREREKRKKAKENTNHIT
jgi:hypothetical protein